MPPARYDTGHESLPSLRASYPVGPKPRQSSAAAMLRRIGAKKSKRSLLSVVVAAKDEASSLPQLVSEVTLALRGLCASVPHGLDRFEIIIVDDGSTDDTQSVLRELVIIYPELRAIALAPGGGQSAAIVAGIRAATGDWVATLDADLQNDPADLARLWNVLPGHNVALGWRQKRQDAWSKRVIGYLANLGATFYWANRSLIRAAPSGSFRAR